MFRSQRIDCVGALPGFTGLYPFYGGFGTWEITFSRARYLAWTAETASIWSHFGGLMPTKVKWSASVGDCALATPGVGSGRAGKYDRWLVGRRSIWIDREYRDELSAILGPNRAP